MRVTIVMGFFLPMPPVAGGATEKGWQLLSRALVRLGHEVTVVSRSWEKWKSDEVIDGVRYLRLPGYDHRRSLALNIVNDVRWSRRVLRALPQTDVTISNAVTLPRWLGRNPKAGRVFVMPGRMPKGQFRWYGRVDRVLAVSRAIESAVLQENPELASKIVPFGYPVGDAYFAASRSASTRPLTIGYVGRIHPEKGLDLLADAVAALNRVTGLPPWRLLVCGPTDIPRGGGGSQYVTELQRKFITAVGAERVGFRSPVFQDAELAHVYAEIDVFCYPSLSARGETFGLAVAEAMATGAVPVVSRLPCFADFVTAGGNGETFAHESADAVADLAGSLARLLGDATRRDQLSAAARKAIKRYAVNGLSLQLSAEFSSLK
jgi:glycosyltransferase involved in cell wall biosynthesis